MCADWPRAACRAACAGSRRGRCGALRNSARVPGAAGPGPRAIQHGACVCAAQHTPPALCACRLSGASMCDAV